MDIQKLLLHFFPSFGPYIAIASVTAITFWKMGQWKIKIEEGIKPHKCLHKNIIDRVDKLEDASNHMASQIEKQDLQFTTINVQLEDIKATTSQAVSLIQNLQKQLMEVALHKKD